MQTDTDVEVPASELVQPVFDRDAYNSYGEHLENDEEQGKRSIVATVLAAIGGAILVAWVIL